MSSKKKSARKIGAANKSPHPSAKKSQRKRQTEPGAEAPPSERIQHYSLPASGKHKTVSVPSDFATVSLTYDPESIRQTFNTIFEGFLKHVQKRQSYIFEGSATGLEMLVEEVNLKKQVDESQDRASSYADIAMSVFGEKLVYALLSFSDQLLLQIIISTLDKLKREGYIKLSKSFNLREIWKKYLASYEKAAKAHWAPMTRGQRVKWPPMRLLKLAKTHESNESTARRLWDIYRSNASRRWRGGQWKEEVRRQFKGAYDWVLDEIPQKKEKGIALLITSKQFGLYESNIKDGVPGIIKRLEEAKRLIEQRSQIDDHTPKIDEDAEDTNFTILEDD